MDMPLQFTFDVKHLTNKQNNVEYTLIEFIHHLGTNNSRHYVNYNIINKKWYRFSDEQVKDLSDVPDGYLYFYIKF